VPVRTWICHRARPRSGRLESRDPSARPGRIEKSQVGVFLTYAGARGYALIDRELYLPRSWTDDPARRSAAGVAAEVGFGTKPARPPAMPTRALDAGQPARWGVGDEVYGADLGLRAALEARCVLYALTLPGDGGGVCYRRNTDEGPPFSISPGCSITSTAAGSA
jgi:SRSO17 transposase